ncbi:MAG: hypothetical protein AUH09_03685 [Candidatus Rokubacteria bacterium 13_2_20CM_70_12]|nr:MAG: hypothetical protein AUH09_03685 [Candidatus Rokubacteria bacterium 13_2_20CM_70_12]
MDEYAKAPVAVRLKRLERTPAELAGAVRGQSEAALARRPDPKLSFDPATPDRWAEERQYLRNDVAAALTAFRKRREESLVLLGALTQAQWERGGVHATRGRITIDDFVTVMAGHDDNHLDQLRRALEGRA